MSSSTAPSARSPSERSVRRLDKLVNPRSVAVVGASTNPSFVSGILKNLLRYGFEGDVVAINPRYDRVLDAPCYPSVLDISHPIDLVVVGVGHRLVPSVLEACERKGVGAVELITSGYSEVGTPEGRQRQDELAAWAERTGIPVGGPNCLGLMNALTGAVALPTVFEKLVPGVVGAVLQSGMMAPTVLVPLLSRDIGLTIAVTTGNEVDVEAADYLRYLVEHDQTRVIACFTEQFKTPERFVEACELAAERQKPIVMLKIGRSEAAGRAAMAHTGSLVGSDAVADLVLRKLGVTRVNTVDDLLEAVAVFHARKLPRGPGVASVIVSGGAAGLLSDLAEDSGVSLPELPTSTAEALKEIVPEYGSVGNPLDITGQGVYGTEILRGSFDLLAEAGNIDIILYGRGFPSRLDRQSPAGQILEQAVEKHPQILFLVTALVGGRLYESQSLDVPVVEPTIHLDGVPFLQGSGAALNAIAALIRYAQFQRERTAAGGRDLARLTSPEAGDLARKLVRAARGRSLTERESKAVLALYGVPTTRERLARTVDEALAAAREIGYPVALKVESPDLLHKSDAGALLLDVGDDGALRAGFERVLMNARGAAPDATIAGVLVQEMVPVGLEVIVGMKRDPQFGPVIACGLGGVFVETLGDVQLLLPPVAEIEARQALERLRGAPLLHGARGRPPADVAALIDVLRRFSELCQDLGDLVEAIDINPLILLESGRGARAVDALIVPSAQTAPGAGA